MRDHRDYVHPGGPEALLRDSPRLADGLHDLPDGGHQADGVARHDDDHNVHRHPRDLNLSLPDQFLETNHSSMNVLVMLCYILNF